MLRRCHLFQYEKEFMTLTRAHVFIIFINSTMIIDKIYSQLWWFSLIIDRVAFSIESSQKKLYTNSLRWMFTFSQWNSVDSIISRRKLTIIIIIMKIFGIHCELKEKKRSKVYFFSLMHFQIFFAFFSVLNCLSLGWKLFCENLYTRFLFWTPCIEHSMSKKPFINR